MGEIQQITIYIQLGTLENDMMMINATFVHTSKAKLGQTLIHT